MAITHFLNGLFSQERTQSFELYLAPPLTQSQASHKPWKAQTLSGWWWQLLLDKTFYLLMLMMMNPEENLKNSKHGKFKLTARLLKPARKELHLSGTRILIKT
jgi:hypothetical protein